MLRNQSSTFISPEDDIVLRAAKKLAHDRLSVNTSQDRDRIADSVIWLARSGYARHSDGTLDAGVLAEAAIIASGLAVPLTGPRRRGASGAHDASLALA